MTEIVKGRTIPQMARRGAKPKYHWIEMKPGDAFKFGSETLITSAGSMASAAGKAYAMKFTVRQEPDGIWCYRIDGLQTPPRPGNVKQDLPIVQREPGPASHEEVVGWEAEDDGEI